MSDLELQRGLATLDTKHPFWQAVQDVLAQAVVNEQLAVAQPDITDGARHYNAGRLAHALDLQTALISLKQSPPPEG